MENIIKAKDIINITWENIHVFSPQDLDDPETLKKFARFAYGMYFYHEPVDMAELFGIIRNFLDKNPSLADTHPELFRRYYELLLVLRACSMGLTSENDMVKFLAEYSLACVAVEIFTYPTFRLEEILCRFLRWTIQLSTDDEKRDIRNLFIKAVEENNEILGIDYLTLKPQNQEVSPVMMNWLKDYNQTSLVQQGQKRGSVERINYMNRSINVKSLNADQKKLLLKYLDLYDWLRFGSLDEEYIIPDEAIRWDYCLYPDEETLRFLASKNLPAPRGIDAPSFHGQDSLSKVIPLPPKPSRTNLIEYKNNKRSIFEDRPIAKPRTNTDVFMPKIPKSSNDSLYKSTLAELKKQREEYEKKQLDDLRSEAQRDEDAAQALQTHSEAKKAEVRENIPPAPEILRQVQKDLGTESYKPFSINEALISAGRDDEVSDRGVIVPGAEIDQKLDGLKKKITGEDK